MPRASFVHRTQYKEDTDVCTLYPDTDIQCLNNTSIHYTHNATIQCPYNTAIYFPQDPAVISMAGRSTRVRSTLGHRPSEGRLLWEIDFHKVEFPKDKIRVQGYTCHKNRNFTTFDVSTRLTSSTSTFRDIFVLPTFCSSTCRGIQPDSRQCSGFDQTTVNVTLYTHFPHSTVNYCPNKSAVQFLSHQE